ncbi:MAG: A/G-specific adenine glycosylase [Vicingaceae bacterium]|nr:A/G-specific adenine glycosylase [Vicingaceae bacterium]
MRFSIDLIEWYNLNKRELPWRNTKDPYTIWLSEIILQQTRVDQGLAYFHKFIDNYPTVEHLSKAPEDEVLKYWQGLGYYSRARNLHFTSKHIVSHYNGVFPNKYKDILSLKGVGEYTAAAISSFSFNQPHPVIDGNVYRVLSRVYGIKEAIDSTIGKKTFKSIAAELIDKKNPSIYNQAIMEFGALQCTPKNPNCEICPFKLECYALKNNQINTLPVKEKRIKQKNRYFNYLIIKNNKSIYLNQRVDNDIWKGLYDFPLIESEIEISKESDLKKILSPPNLTIENRSKPIKHILSHQKIYATFWTISDKISKDLIEKAIKINLKEINNYPVPKLIENYIKSML